MTRKTRYCFAFGGTALLFWACSCFDAAAASPWLAGLGLILYLDRTK
ncbi:MAG: hypothetical protein OEY01_10810 [Desulfobulbaceae bacterium]|nr:hypothetical protein [Desulfobulbaceae bacterium]